MGNRFTKKHSNDDKKVDPDAATDTATEEKSEISQVHEVDDNPVTEKSGVEEDIGDKQEQKIEEMQEEKVEKHPEDLKEKTKPQSKESAANFEPNYFEGHDCMWKSEHLELYEIKCGAIRKLIMYLTCPRSWDLRAKDMYRSYAGLFAEVRRQFDSHPWTIHPFSRLRLGLEIFVVINYHICLASIVLYLQEDDYNPYRHYSIVAFEGLYIIFIASNFFTGYVEGTTNAHVVLDLKKIFCRYLRSWFVVDAFYPWGMHVFYCELAGPYSLQVDTVVYTLKVLRLPTVVSFSINIMSILQCSERLKTIMHILIVISNYLLWNVFFQFSVELVYENAIIPVNPRACSWLSVTKLWNGSIAERRAYAFNRAVGMLRRHSNVDMVAAGACVETFYIIFWIIGWLVCIHCAAKLMILMIGEESARAHFLIMAQQVKTYMDQQRYPERIKQKAMKFYAARFHSIFFSEHKMMSCMSGQLRDDVIMHINRQLVSEVEFLKKLPRSLLLSIGTRLKIVVFLAGDIIFKINAVADCLYFIDKGTVAVYSESGMEICHLQDGDYFGEIALVLPPRFRVASVVAITNCELFRLDKKDFDATIARFPTVYEDIKQGALSRRERLKVIDEHHKAEWSERNEAQDNRL